MITSFFTKIIRIEIPFPPWNIYIYFDRNGNSVPGIFPIFQQFCSRNLWKRLEPKYHFSSKKKGRKWHFSSYSFCKKKIIMLFHNICFFLIMVYKKKFSFMRLFHIDCLFQSGEEKGILNSSRVSCMFVWLEEKLYNESN